MLGARPLPSTAHSTQRQASETANVAGWRLSSANRLANAPSACFKGSNLQNQVMDASVLTTPMPPLPTGGQPATDPRDAGRAVEGKHHAQLRWRLHRASPDRQRTNQSSMGSSGSRVAGPAAPSSIPAALATAATSQYSSSAAQQHPSSACPTPAAPQQHLQQYPCRPAAPRSTPCLATNRAACCAST